MEGKGEEREKEGRQVGKGDIGRKGGKRRLRMAGRRRGRKGGRKRGMERGIEEGR